MLVLVLNSASKLCMQSDIASFIFVGWSAHFSKTAVCLRRAQLLLLVV